MGVTVSGPDFILIGAMKCGTSTLAEQLAHQQGVFMTTPKEPNFFSDDDIFARGPDWYRALFDAAGAGELKGEASTHYTKMPTYPQTLARMTAMLPELKLVYMIRDPMARAISHYIHEWTERRMALGPDRAFLEVPEIVEYGRYGTQIAPYVAAYGVENVCLTSLEQIKADGPAEFARIAAFLGLPGAPGWIHDLPDQNVSAERTRRLPFQEILIDNPVARALRHVLVPKSVRRRIRDSRTMADRPGIPAEHAKILRERFLEDREQLAGFFRGHPALDLCYPFAPG